MEAKPAFLHCRMLSYHNKASQKFARATPDGWGDYCNGYHIYFSLLNHGLAQFASLW